MDGNAKTRINMQLVKMRKNMNKAIALLSVAIISGCGSMEYAKNLTASDLLYADDVAVSTATKPDDLEAVALSVGSDKTGFVLPDRTPDRLRFEKAYPIQAPPLSTMKALSSYNYTTRAGQVLVFAADIDKRTSGYLKDANNSPLSVTGRFAVQSAGEVAGGLAASSLGYQAGSGGQAPGANIVGGWIARGINSSVAASAVKGFLETTDFGERMEHSTLLAAELLPRAFPLGSRGEYLGDVKPVIIAPGIVKQVWIKRGTRGIDSSTRFFLISTVATYRGDTYAQKFPNTSGWECRITNLNTFATKAQMDTYEQTYKEIKKALKEYQISL